MDHLNNNSLSATDSSSSGPSQTADTSTPPSSTGKANGDLKASHDANPSLDTPEDEKKVSPVLNSDNIQSTTPSQRTSEESPDRDGNHIIWNAGTNNSHVHRNGIYHHPKPEEEEESVEPERKFKIRLRGYDDTDDVDWWFASTACPLLAATIAPLANVLSIAALVTFWRMNINDGHGGLVADFEGLPYPDPRWCYWINAGSLICGFVGNIFLLFNFTGRIRYIIALPATIFFFYIATFLLVGITVSLHIYAPPTPPYEIYSQGFWYAVISIVLYFVCSTLLMANMSGYFLGHYPQRFELNEHQRTLILQTMLFFFWLAGGGAVFSHVENTNANGDRNWAFVDGLYFCDVTILTLGFGDLVPHNNLGRGLVFPYSVGGIIMLGLVISSISKFAAEMSEENVIRKHFNRERTRTLERTMSNADDYDNLQNLNRVRKKKPTISAPFAGRMMNSKQERTTSIASARSGSQRRASIIPVVNKRANFRDAIRLRRKRIKLLEHERDRFNEMRRIQASTQSFKNWWALTLSIISFSTLWCVGALVFWRAEQSGQGWSYFDALYFSYISLLTIGYGDFTPTSNAGRSFFVVWSLIAVPTMTLLVSDMSTTVIDSFNRGTNKAAEFTVLLEKNVWQDFLQKHPSVKRRVDKYSARRAEKKRLKRGMLSPGDVENDDGLAEIGESIVRPSIDTLASEVNADQAHPPKLAHVARRLALAIRSVASDINNDEPKHYSFEEWAELTRLIRFTSKSMDSALEMEEEDVIEWDWLGEDSPLMASASEPEFILEKLCESLVRYTRRVEKGVSYGMRELRKKKAEKEISGDHKGMEALKMAEDMFRGRMRRDDDNNSHEKKRGTG